MSCISLPSPHTEAAGFNHTWPLISCLPPGRTSESCVHTEQMFGCIFPYGFSRPKFCAATGVLNVIQFTPGCRWLPQGMGAHPGPTQRTCQKKGVSDSITGTQHRLQAQDFWARPGKGSKGPSLSFQTKPSPTPQSVLWPKPSRTFRLDHPTLLSTPVPSWPSIAGWHLCKDHRA